MLNIANPQSFFSIAKLSHLSHLFACAKRAGKRVSRQSKSLKRQEVGSRKSKRQDRQCLNGFNGDLMVI